MISLLIEKELRHQLRTRMFAVTFAVCSLVIVSAFFLGGRSYETARERYEAAVVEGERQARGQTDWLMVRPTVSLPPQPLAFLVSGIANDVGRNVEVRGRGALAAEDSLYGEDVLLAIFRVIDLEFAFQVVLSLFAILFCFDAICGERERGTLRLAMSNAIPRSHYIIGKVLGSWAALTIPLLIPLTMGMALLIAMGIPLGVDEVIRLALIVFAGLLYLGAVLGVSVFVSALCRQSTTSFVILLSIWVIGVLVLPRASVAMAGRSIDVPSIDSVLSQRSRLQSQLWSEDRRAINDFLNNANFGSDAESSSGSSSNSITEFNSFFEKLSEERAARLAELDRRLTEERQNRQRRQQRWAFTLARLSPASALSLVIANLAGTSLDLPKHFIDLVESYQERFSAFQREKTGSAGGSMRIMVRTSDAEAQKPQPLDLAEMPKFDFQPEPMEVVVSRALPDLALLGIANLLFFAGAFVAFLVYDVR